MLLDKLVSRPTAAAAALVLSGWCTTAHAAATDDAVKLAEALVGRGDAKKALVQIEKNAAAIDAAGDTALSARLHKAWGLALIQQKKNADAVTHLERALTLSPKDEKAWLYLAMAQEGAAALATLEKARDALPKSSAVLAELGMAYLEAGRAEDAATALVAGTKITPGDPDLATDAAYALSLNGRFAEAKEMASVAVSLAPESADAHFNLGTAELGLHNKKAAQAALLRAVAIDELHVPALLQLGLVEVALNDDKGAVAHLNRVLQVEPANLRAKATLGQALARLGTDDKQAKALLLAVVQADGKNAMAHAMLGDVAEREGNFGEAITRYERVRKLMPGDKAIEARLQELKARGKKK